MNHDATLLTLTYISFFPEPTRAYNRLQPSYNLPAPPYNLPEPPYNRVIFAESQYNLRLIFVYWSNLGVYWAKTFATQSLPALRIFYALRVYLVH